MMYVGIAAIVIVLAFAIIRTKRWNSRIKREGIEANAVVTRVTERDSFDADGSWTDTTRTYYVSYRTMNGQTVEAQLGSDKTLNVRFTKNTWDRDLQEGSSVRIMYLPEKPNYAIRVE